MNLCEAKSGAKEGQLEAIEQIDGPLLISAGAGTGKTFTLTWRLVNAIVSTEERAPEDVGELLVITFTDKAAGELVARVRKALRDEGLLEDALRIDNAWISTIHGMCQRILREHATEVGLDPFFQIIGEQEGNKLFQQAFEQALAAKMADTGDEGELLSAHRLSDVEGYVSTICKALQVFPGGEDRLDIVLDTKDISQLMRRYIEIEEACRDDYETMVATNKKPGAYLLGNLAQARESVDTISQIMSEADDLTDEECAAKLLAAFSDLQMPRKAGKATADTDAKAQDLYLDTVCELACIENSGFTEFVFDLARRTGRIFGQLKLEGDEVDLDDLLKLTHELLTGHPDIAAEYGEKFKLVMVDEFQDTDQLQIEMIEAICGHGCKTLATVGDEQQSIYGFRNADVAVYRAHKHRMVDELKGKGIELQYNFRSHADILTAVNTIFSQDQVFGQNMIKLQHGRKETPSEHQCPDGTLADGSERVRILMMSSVGGSGAGAAMRGFEAGWIADQFEELLQTGRGKAGFRKKDMALLLGKATNVETFSEAFRERGIDCLTNAGTRYYESDEVGILILLLRVMADPHDDAALLPLLASPVFDLTDDDLVHLETVRRSMKGSAGYSDALVSRRLEIMGPDGERLARAGEQLTRLLDRSRTVEPYRLLEEAIEDSVWDTILISQGVEGTVAYANIVKFIDKVREAGAVKGATLSSIADGFTRLRDMGQKEGYGTLVAGDVDAVRILTIHKSKGLEFPVVAVAEFFESPEYLPESLLLQPDGGKLHGALKLQNEFYADKAYVKGKIDKRMKEFYGSGSSIGFSIDDSSMFAHMASIREKQRRAAVEERRRLFYVACTRARDVLMLTGFTTGKQFPDATAESKVCLFDLASAFFENGVYPSKRTCTFPLDGNRGGMDVAEDAGPAGRGRFTRYDFKLDDKVWRPDLAEGEEAAAAPAAHITASHAQSTVPPFPFVSRARQTMGTWQRTRWSYSSLSAFAKHHVDFTEEGLDPDLARKPAADIAPAEDRDDPLAAVAMDVVPGETADEAEAGSGDRSSETQADATSFGSAMHLMNQMMVEGRVAGQAPKVPDRERIDALVREYGLAAGQAEALLRAGRRWAESDLAAEAFSYDRVLAEVPFNLLIGGQEGDQCEERFFLEGSIDLLCTDAGREHALIVDYKSGTLPAVEGEGGLEGRYELQARCYAYAAMRAGFKDVKVVYVRPEVEDEAHPGQPQTVFPDVPQDRDVLEYEIVETHRRAVAV